MSKRSDLWRQAQVCLSLARLTDDPALKELYEDMAVEFAHTAARQPDFDNVKEGGLRRAADRRSSLNSINAAMRCVCNRARRGGQRTS
jgi:hypothetical protein